MKRNILLVVALFFAAALSNAQNTVPNAGFENWTTKSYFELDNYVTGNGQSLFSFGFASTIRSSDSQNGNYSIRLETSIQGTDTIFGFFTAGEFGQSNGFPYAQNPDSLVGYYKCGLQPGDTGIIVLQFSTAGVPTSFQTFPFSGAQNNWTRFAFATNQLVAPDSVFIGAASSNAVSGIGVQDGSWLMLDNLSFVGTGLTQPILNGDFENWSTVSYEDPDFWFTFNGATAANGSVSAIKTTDSHSGSFALRLETIEAFDDTIGLITNGRFGQDSIIGGQPFSVVFDTLVGYYKYSPIGIDTAAIGLYFSSNSNFVGAAFQALTAQSTYTTFEIPFVLPQVPDTMRIDINASIRENTLGSTLFIDDLALKSIITSIDEQGNFFKEVSLYPNPAADFINVSFHAIADHFDLQIIDGLGRVYEERRQLQSDQQLQIPLDQLAAGIYFLRLNIKGEQVHYRFIKQ